MFNNTKGSYFSINKYIIDEWQTHAGEPITFLKSVKMNGKLDTSYTNVLQMDWKPVLSVFSATDISDRKFLGKYTFSQFEDNFDNTLNYMYVADREDLFTQKLLITIDNRSRKVKGIYIETLKSNFFGETRQKLFYSPARTIQIQQYDKPLIGAKKDLVVSYESVEQ
ncbi:MAG: hypothetical protein EBZ77_13370 [Chitinophagia bacterium]|nr:hypothetical protein [Chitinophagia bacterium]